MFNNFLLKEVLEHSFNIPVQVTYANGKTERYGDGEPQVKITFHRDFSMREKHIWIKKLRSKARSKT